MTICEAPGCENEVSGGLPWNPKRTCSARCRQRAYRAAEREAKAQREAAYKARQAYLATPEGQAEAAEREAKYAEINRRYEEERQAREAQWREYKRRSAFEGLQELFGSHEDNHYTEEDCGPLAALATLERDPSILAGATVRELKEIEDDLPAMTAALTRLLPIIRAEIRGRPKDERDEANRERREARQAAREF
jgi:hypothetical protein